MEQKIIWTALPKSVTNDNGTTRLELTVRVSPQLTADGPEGVLGSFIDFSSKISNNLQANWADRKLKFKVQFGTGVPANIIWHDPVDALMIDERDPDVWNAVFPPKTPVRSYQFKNFSAFRIRSFPVAEVLSFIQGVYQEAGLKFPSDLPPNEYLMPSRETNSPCAFSALAAVPVKSDAEFTKGWRNGVYTKPHQGLDDFYQLYKFHGFKGNKEVKPIEKIRLDFHEMITMMEDYKPVMRKLGLVFDLVCDPPVYGSQAPQTIKWVRVIPHWESQSNNTNITPVTAFLYDSQKKRFQAAPKQNSEIKNGLFDLSTPFFGLMQVDVDGSALKLIDFAWNLSRMIYMGVTSMDTPSKAGLPALRTGGLSVFRTGRDSAVYKRMTHAAEMNVSLQSGSDTVIPLYADDLIRGYRVDVLDVDHVKRWISLCERNETYVLKSNVTFEPNGLKGESTVSSTVAKDENAPSDIYLHESLFHWDGWSLAVKRPGKTIVAPGDAPGYVGENQPEIDPDLGLNVQFQPVKNSLPRLRFGRTYRIRARAVDISGHSQELTQDAALDCASAPTVYRRFEPIASPVLASEKQFDYGVPGESMERMVIRSYDSSIVAETTVRHVAPPRTSQQMAEQHGMFDTSCPNGNWHEVLCSRHGDDAHMPEVVTPQFKVPYLPDPMACGAALRGFPSISDLTLVDFGENVPWPSASPFRIVLTEGEKALSWDKTNRILTLNLPKGEMARFRISCHPKDLQDLSKLGIWDWLMQAASDERRSQLENLTINGGHWMISPFREITLVHAVQKPIEPAMLDDIVLLKNLGNTYVEFENSIKIHGKSTGKVDIHASWKDREDKLETGTGDEWSCHEGQPFDLIAGAPDKNSLDCVGKRHEFGDTRYRRVTYKAVATSRFREYYDQKNNIDFTLPGEEVALHVLNSARPSAPSVEYIIPTFTWEQERKEDGNMVATERRRLGGLRIYLNRPWYVSGEGELLGVIIAQGPHAGATATSLPSPLKHHVTQSGMDPIQISGPTYFAPTIHHFPKAVAEETGVTIEETPCLPEAADSWWLSVLGHQVEFDQERQLWYSDIAIDAGPSYFPFVRLALARYQPMSVRGAQLSKVTLADFIQLTPDRHAWVRTTPDQPLIIQVSVSGIAPLAPKKKTPTNVMVVRAEMLHPDGETWLPVTPSWLPMIRTQITAPFTVWNGLVPIPLPRDERSFRLVIEEYELLDGDRNWKSVVIGDVFVGLNNKKERLVYADTIPL